MSAAELPQASPDKKRRSWRLRWSLRTLIIFVTLLCIPLTVVSVWMRQGYVHEDVASELQQLGASVDWKLVEIRSVQGKPASSTTPLHFFSTKVKKGPDWMQAIGAEPIFQRITYVTIRQVAPDKLDAALQQAERLGRVDGVTLSGTDVSEAQLAQLIAQLQMRSLGVSETKIGRGSLPFLCDTNLKWISFHRTHFSDIAIDDLPESVEYFDATRTRITDKGLDKFVRLKNLKTLKLPRTPTTEEGIENLRREMPWCEIHWRPLTHF